MTTPDNGDEEEDADALTPPPGGNDEPPPPSPWPVETIRFMRGLGDELLAVLLRGGPHVGETTVALDVAGPFLFRLHELVHAVASSLTGRPAGRRGTLPDVPGVGLLSLAGMTSGASVTFHFALGPGEAFQLGQTPLTEQAVEQVVALVDATRTQQDDALFARTRELGPRVGTNYLGLMHVLSQHHVQSVWQPADRREALSLPVTIVERAKEVLEISEPPRVFDERVKGLLYRADSKDHQFILEPIDREEDKISGFYEAELREEIRDAWDKVVTVRLLTTHHFLARQIEPARVEVQLLGIDAVHDER